MEGPVATLTLQVDEQGGLLPGYELKMNSYDLGVDIELYDAVQRLRFEHPAVKAVTRHGLRDRWPGGSRKVGVLGVDTPLVSGWEG